MDSAHALGTQYSVSSPMPIESAFNIYQDQLKSLFHGIALWNPDPHNHNVRVSIGDVGFLVEGAFFRMFNVMDASMERPVK